jgi:hypothetical protein
MTGSSIVLNGHHDDLDLYMCPLYAASSAEGRLYLEWRSRVAPVLASTCSGGVGKVGSKSPRPVFHSIELWSVPCLTALSATMTGLPMPCVSGSIIIVM